jgi:hypothetical protein
VLEYAEEMICHVQVVLMLHHVTMILQFYLMMVLVLKMTSVEFVAEAESLMVLVTVMEMLRMNVAYVAEAE